MKCLKQSVEAIYAVTVMVLFLTLARAATHKGSHD